MKLSKLLLVVVVAGGLLGITAGLLGQDDSVAADDVVVRAVGLQIALRDGTDDDAESFVDSMQPGTRVFFVATLSGQAVIEVVEDECTIGEFTDDTGKVLLEPGEADRFGWDNGLTNTDISDEGQMVQFGLGTEETPAAAATSLNVAATMVFLVGTAEDTATVENVTIADGEAIGVGGYVFDITGVNNEPWGEAAMAIELESSKSFAGIKALRVFNAEGEGVKVEYRSSGYYGGGGSYTYMQTIALSEAVETATVTIEYYSETEKVTVPVEATVGVGLE